MSQNVVNLNKKIEDKSIDFQLPDINLVFEETDFVGRRNEQGYLVLPKEYDDGYDGYDNYVCDSDYDDNNDDNTDDGDNN